MAKERVDVDDGVLVGIGGVLEPPPSLGTSHTRLTERHFGGLTHRSAAIIPNYSSLSYFNRIKNTEVDHELGDLSGLTVFLPIDSAWDSLHPIERLYLESKFATDDLLKILHGHAVGESEVLWSESFDPGVNRRFSLFTEDISMLITRIVKTISGHHLKIATSPEKVVVNDAELIQPDMYASNGVIHTVSSLLLPASALRLTPEKYLLALKCTHFVSLLHSVGLNSLINDPDAQYTILAPADDVISLFGDSDLPEKGSDELRRALQYHFIPDRWTPNKMKHNMLLETALKEPGLNHKPQVLQIELTHGATQSGETKVRFGGVGTVQDLGKSTP